MPEVWNPEVRSNANREYGTARDGTSLTTSIQSKRGGPANAASRAEGGGAARGASDEPFPFFDEFLVGVVAPSG